jgi:hypothetical protein
MLKWARVSTWLANRLPRHREAGDGDLTRLTSRITCPSLKPSLTP